MNKRLVAEALISFVGSASVGGVVSNIIKATTPPDLKFYRSVMQAVGSFIITNYIAQKGCEYLLSEMKGVLDYLVPEPKKEDVVE